MRRAFDAGFEAGKKAASAHPNPAPLVFELLRCHNSVVRGEDGEPTCDACYPNQFTPVFYYNEDIRKSNGLRYEHSTNCLAEAAAERARDFLDREVALCLCQSGHAHCRLTGLYDAHELSLEVRELHTLDRE